MPDKIKSRANFLINVAFAAVILVLVYLGFQYVLGWVLPFVIAFAIVSVVHPLVNFLKKHLGLNQKSVSLFVMILIYVIIATLLFLLVMQVIYLAQAGFTALPIYFEESMKPSLMRAGDSIMAFINNLPEGWKQQITDIQAEIIKGLQSFALSISQKGVTAIPAMTSSIPSFLIAFVFTIMLSFFISTRYDSVIGFFSMQMSPKVKGIFSTLRGIIRTTVAQYFKAALTLMAITFVELSIGLLVLGTGKAIVIAAGIAVFDALPFFGTGAIMIPWFIIELLQGNYTYALGLIIVYAIVTFIRNIIEPKIVGDKLGLNPIVSLSAIYLGFKLFGVLGMIFMPICTQIALELHYRGQIKLFRDAVEGDNPPETN